MSTDTASDWATAPARIELGDGPTVALIGQFDLAAAPMLRACLAGFSGGPLVIDMSGAEFIDSTALGVLVASHKAGTEVTITGARGTVRKVLAISGLDEVLRVQDS